MVTGSTDQRIYNRKHNETQKYVKKKIVYPDIGNLKVKGNIIIVQHFFIHILYNSHTSFCLYVEKLFFFKEKQFNKELANFSVLT